MRPPEEAQAHNGVRPGWFGRVDRLLISEMHRWGIPLLRIALGVVFIWFGALKIVGASPVAELIRSTYSFLPDPPFLAILGIWEVVVGIGLIFRLALRFTLALLWLQMAGTFAATLFQPSLFFRTGNPLLLTTEGEFVMKNLVLIASGIVIGGYEVKPRAQLDNGKSRQ